MENAGVGTWNAEERDRWSEVSRPVEISGGRMLIRGQPCLNLIRGEAVDSDGLGPGAFPGNDLDLGLGEPQSLGEKCDKGLVGLSVDGRRCQFDPVDTGLLAQDLILGGAGEDTHGEIRMKAIRQGRRADDSRVSRAGRPSPPGSSPGTIG
jgi:hypothetical protein